MGEENSVKRLFFQASAVFSKKQHFSDFVGRALTSYLSKGNRPQIYGKIHYQFGFNKGLTQYI